MYSVLQYLTCNPSFVLWGRKFHLLKVVCVVSTGHTDPCDGEGVGRQEIQEHVCHQPVTRGIWDRRLYHWHQGGTGRLAGRPPPAPLWPGWVGFCVNMQQMGLYLYNTAGFCISMCVYLRVFKEEVQCEEHSGLERWLHIYLAKLRLARTDTRAFYLGLSCLSLFTIRPVAALLRPANEDRGRVATETITLPHQAGGLCLQRPQWVE